MSVEYIEKWNKYKIGEIEWINNRKLHPHIPMYVSYVLDNITLDQKVLEIGAGECIEAQKVRAISKKGIKYVIMDVSDTFLKFANSLGFPTIKANMIKTDAPNKVYDLVYCCCILEHSPDIIKTIEELARISKSFYFTFFKWRFKGGSLNSEYHGKKKYYSSDFNLFQLMQLIKKYGTIDKFIVSKESGEYCTLNEYASKECTDIDFHRNRNYLSLIGHWNG